MTCPAFHYLFLLFFSFLLLSAILGHGVTILPKLALNSQSSCRDLTSSGATHVYHHTWLMYYFLIPSWLVIKQLLFLPVWVRKRSEKLVIFLASTHCPARRVICSHTLYTHPVRAVALMTEFKPWLLYYCCIRQGLSFICKAKVAHIWISHLPITWLTVSSRDNLSSRKGDCLH